ncbi:MAG: A24 family peptidase [archaeon]
MLVGIIIIVIALAATAYGSYTDIKIREVPNWITFPLIGVMLLLRFIDYAITRNAGNLVYSLITGGVFLAIGLFMFYTSQWGGADLKMLTAFGFGFGTLLGPFSPQYVGPWPFGITLLMNLLIIAACYSIIFGLGVSVGNKKVYEETKKSMKQYEMHGIFLLFIVGSLAAMFDPIYFLVAMLAPLWLLMRYMKSVEKHCLNRLRSWDQVVEFDVPIKDIKVKGKVVMNSKDPNGFTPEKLKYMKQLAREGKIPKQIKVKWGLPLTPAFPMALLMSVFFGDLLYWFMQIII